MTDGNHWPRVAVMGGSLGGLTAGLVLRDLGCDVDVCERSASELESRGAGIVVHPMTVRYFSQRGGPDIERLSTHATLRRYLDTDGGVAHEYPRDYRFTAYNTLYGALLERFGRERYHLGHAIAHIDARRDDVSFIAADGDRERFDLLVCADGISSTARAELMPDRRPRYAGYVAWRGMVPEPALSGPAYSRLHDALTYVLLPSSHILTYPIPSVDGAVAPGQRLINFVWYRNVDGDELEALLTDPAGAHRPLSMPPGSIAQHFIDDLRAVAERELPAPMAEVVIRTEQPFLQVVVDIDVPRMVIGRACLMGDAAFTVRPHTAAATAKAAADAWKLAECLADAKADVDVALAMWEREQFEVGSRLLARARAIGERSQSPDDRWDPRDPAMEFGLYGPGW